MMDVQFMAGSYRNSDYRRKRPTDYFLVNTPMTMEPTQRTEFGRRLVEAREDAQMTQEAAAKAVGMSQSALAEAEISGKRSGFTAQLAEIYKVSATWLAKGVGRKEAMHHVLSVEPGHYKVTGQDVTLAVGRAKVEIPMLAAVASMGPGVTLDDDDTVVDRITVKREWLQTTLPGCRYDRLAVISGKGDSMEPTFSDGDLLLVDTSKTTVDIDGVYVLSAHKRLFIKSVRQRIDGSYEISSDNPKIKTVDVLNGDHEVTVHGRVVLVWGAKKL